MSARLQTIAQGGAGPLRLRRHLRDAGIQVGELATHLRISRPAVSQLVNHGIWPATNADAIASGIDTFLLEKGAANHAWRECEQPTQDKPEETLAMLLEKQTVTPQARRHFNLVGDPFADPTKAEDVFLSQDMRYVRESMFGVARNGGFMAVVAESGAGKSTIREELGERIEAEAPQVTMITPYVIMSEDKDEIGKPLRSQHIVEAIMACVDPMAKTRSSPDARARQMHESLRQSAKAGRRHLLLIEEAHSLPIITLKHLKRFMEIKDGLRPLLSILLLAQPELLVKLSAANSEIREVRQRLEIIKLPPLGANLEPYLAHRFKRIGMSVDAVFDQDVLQALRTRLTPAKGAESMLYPLVVHNTLAAAINRAADLGMPRVTADLVRGV